MKKAGIIILSLIIVGAILYSFYMLWKQSQPDPVVYEILEAKYADLERNTVFIGKIAPEKEVPIKARVGGVIREIYKKEGDYVEEEEAIALISIIVNMDSLNSAQASAERAAIEYQKQQAFYERNQHLYSNAVISDEEMEKITADFESAESTKASSDEYLNIQRYGYPNSGKRSGNVLILSTASGMILNMPVIKGNTIIPVNILNPGTTIATVGNPHKMIFKTNVDEMEIDKLYVGMPVKLFPRVDKTTSLEGEISYISQINSNETGAAFYEVEASVRIPDSVKIRTNTSANAQVTLAAKQHVLTIPESAVSFENDSTFVYLYHKKMFGQSFERRHVELGLSDKINVEVLSGLKESEKVRGNRIIVRK